MMADQTIGDGVPSTTGDTTDYSANLIQSRLQVSQRIRQITASPKPSYTVNGQTISWTAYLAELRKQLNELNSLIVEGDGDGTPFEIISQGVSR